MLGRIRMRPSSFADYFCDGDGDGDPPSKIIKDDCLSIYEATLIKLKHGSQHSLSSAAQVAEEGEAGECSSSFSMETGKLELKCSPESLPASEEEMMIDVIDPSASSTDSRSTSVAKQKQSRNVSVLHMFSKYTDSKHVPSSSHEVSMMDS